MHRRNGLEFRSFVPVHHFLNHQNRLEQLRIQRELKLEKLKKQQKMLKKQRAEQLSGKKRRQKFNYQSKNSTEPNNQKKLFNDHLDRYDRFLKQKVLYSDSLDPAEGDNAAMVRK